MTTLTLAKLAEIEQAAAKATGLGRWYNNGELQFCEQDATFIALCDPATVAALVRIARAAIAVVDQDDRGAYVRRNDAASNAMETLRAAGLLDDKP